MYMGTGKQIRQHSFRDDYAFGYQLLVLESAAAIATDDDDNNEWVQEFLLFFLISIKLLKMCLSVK